MPVDPSRAPLADKPAAHETALLIVDMISAWDFPDAGQLARGAVAIAPRIGALKRRCRRAGVPVVYANDNRDHWRSEFRALATMAAKASAWGEAIAEHLQPDDEDFTVLKPKHSAFFATPLDLLLRHLRVRKLLITGVSSDLCILMTAVDARMRDYESVVPGDCVAALTAARSNQTLRMLDVAHHMATTPSARIRFKATA